jgi:hypothetical protein
MVGNDKFLLKIKDRKVIVQYGVDFQHTQAFEGGKALGKAFAWLVGKEDFAPNEGLIQFENARFINGESYRATVALAKPPFSKASASLA